MRPSASVWMTWIVVPSTRGHEILRLVGVDARRFSVIASHASIAERYSQLGERQQRAERHGAALHVRVHVEHADEGLQVRAARVEDHAFADEREARGARRRSVDSAGARCRHRASALPRATAKNAPAPSFFELALAEKSAGDAARFRERFDGLAVRRHRQDVGRQSSEPTRDVVAQSLCARRRRGRGRCVRANRRKLVSCAGRGVLPRDLNAGRANAAALAAATRLSAAVRAVESSRPTSAMPSVRGLSRKHSRTAFAAHVSAAKPGVAPKAPTVRPVARAFAARELAKSSPFFVARASSGASVLPYGRRASARASPRAATTSKWSRPSSVARVGAKSRCRDTKR